MGSPRLFDTPKRPRRALMTQTDHGINATRWTCARCGFDRWETHAQDAAPPRSKREPCPRCNSKVPRG